MKDGREERYYNWAVCIQSGHATNPATAPGVWIQKNVWVGGGDRRYPYNFRYGVEEFLPPWPSG